MLTPQEKALRVAVATIPPLPPKPPISSPLYPVWEKLRSLGKELRISPTQAKVDLYHKLLQECKTAPRRISTIKPLSLESRLRAQAQLMDYSWEHAWSPDDIGQVVYLHHNPPLGPAQDAWQAIRAPITDAPIFPPEGNELVRITDVYLLWEDPVTGEPCAHMVQFTRLRDGQPCEVEICDSHENWTHLLSKVPPWDPNHKLNAGWKLGSVPRPPGSENKGKPLNHVLRRIKHV